MNSLRTSLCRDSWGKEYRLEAAREPVNRGFCFN
jgi:hypothetical protein